MGQTSKHIRYLIGIIVFVSICALTAWAAPAGSDKGTWLSIVPPLLAVTLALITHRVILSLAISVFVAGLLAAVPVAPLEITQWGMGLLSSFKFVSSSALDKTNLQILFFIIFVLTMISVAIVAGGLQGVVHWLARFAKGSKSTQLATFFTGLAVFIDDYANTMIVGSAMRPAADRNQVSREKLAFLVDATSAPVAGIAIISTWIGYEVGLFGDVAQSLNIAKDGYAMFFDALAFRFYCFMMLIFVFLNALTGEDFGPMAKAQRRTEKTGQVAAPDAQPMTSTSFSMASPDKAARIQARNALIPIVGLLIFLLSGIWIDGNGLNAVGLFSLDGWRTTISAAENSVFTLMVSAIVGLGIAIVCATAFARIGWKAILRGILAGIKGSLLPIVILILAWSLKNGCDALQTGAFITATVGDVLSPLLFPAILFVMAGITAFATGTSWGTMAILIPTAIPVAFQLDGGSYGLVTMISLGAVLDGAIFGDHCSPISDTTIMSSIASDCDHIHHVQTQLPYALTVGSLAIVCGYLPAAVGIAPWVGLLAATAIILTLFLGLRWARKNPFASFFAQPAES